MEAEEETEMTIGSGIAVCGVWLGAALICWKLHGYATAFPQLVVAGIACAATYYIAGGWQS